LKTAQIETTPNQPHFDAVFFACLVVTTLHMALRWVERYIFGNIAPVGRAKDGDIPATLRHLYCNAPQLDSTIDSG
jgi:hypothetical protein